MQTTYRAVNMFVGASNSWYARATAPDKPNGPQKVIPDTKFQWAMRKVTKPAARLLEQFQQHCQDAEIAHCSVDKDGNIIRDAQGKLAFTKSEQKALSTDLANFWDLQVEIEPYFSKGAPPAMTGAERDAFSGFVLPDVDESELAD